MESTYKFPFEKLEVWDMSKYLVLKIYEISKYFPED